MCGRKGEATAQASSALKPDPHRTAPRFKGLTLRVSTVQTASLRTLCPGWSCKRFRFGKLGFVLLSSACSVHRPPSYEARWEDTLLSSACNVGIWAVPSILSAKELGVETRAPSRERFPRRLDSTLAILTLCKGQTDRCYYLQCKTQTALHLGCW